VEVGYQTIIRGDEARTGVTGIHPRGRDGALDPLAAGYAAQNGNGEMTGAAWIAESGTTSLPIALTNTHAVGIAHAGIIAWAVRHYPELGDNWSLPVAAETWDGYLNDINGQHVAEQDCVAALDAARSGPLDEAIDPFFTAVVQGTEEAVANALCAGEAMTGYRGHRVPGLPRDRLAALFQEG
jgi:D-aminopeptidase